MRNGDENAANDRLLKTNGKHCVRDVNANHRATTCVCVISAKNDNQKKYENGLEAL